MARPYKIAIAQRNEVKLETAKDEYLQCLARLKYPDKALDALNAQRPQSEHISHRRVAKWREEDSRFAQQCEYWADHLKARLEGIAHEMAIDERDGAMVRFLLKSHFPEKYGNKTAAQTPQASTSYLPPIDADFTDIKPADE